MKKILKNKYIISFILSMVLLAASFSFESAQAAGNILTSYTSEMEYDVNTGYYVQTTVTVSEYYDSVSGCNVRCTDTVIKYYSFDGSAYILESTQTTTQNEYIPMPTATPSMPSVSTSVPIADISPSPMPSPDNSGDSLGEIEFNTNAVKFSVSRKSTSKAKISWTANKKADGYYIFRATKEDGKYEKVKTIKDYSIVSYTDKNLKADKIYYYKIQAYLHTEAGVMTTDMPEAEQVSTIKTQSVINKLNKLKKIFPDGKYWNHVGYKVSVGQSTYGFVTDKPCNHKGAPNGIASTCNKYSVKINNTIMTGYQCYGFANMIGDKLFGKTKIKVHHSYKKAKVGDHVRYGNHSVVIIEKHAKYIKVVECNIGNTCMIKWGRKISKSALKGATYYTR